MNKKSPDTLLSELNAIAEKAKREGEALGKLDEAKSRTDEENQDLKRKLVVSHYVWASLVVVLIDSYLFRGQSGFAIVSLAIIEMFIGYVCAHFSGVDELKAIVASFVRSSWALIPWSK